MSDRDQMGRFTQASNLTPVEQQVLALRDVRAWHWNQTMHNRAMQRVLERGPGSFSQREAARRGRIADGHIRAVQALNGALPERAPTAERDAADGYGEIIR